MRCELPDHSHPSATHPASEPGLKPQYIPRGRKRCIPAFTGWVIGFFAFLFLFPTLGWLEFANGIEGLHAATALEIRRDGNWLIPTLNGGLRIQKPPLPAWISALAVTEETVQGTQSISRAERDAAFGRLAWQIRWPVLLAGCLMLVATFDLATTLGRSRRVGFWAAVIAASTYLFLRFVRLGSTDVHLALWVAAANAMLARLALRGQIRLIVPIGAALGLAVMSKGPVALLQTIVPFACWAAALRWIGPPLRSSGSSGAASTHNLSSDIAAGPPVVRDPLARRLNSKRMAGWIALSVFAFLLVALPWPILVATLRPGTLSLWWKEVTRSGAIDREPGPIWSYLSLFVYLMPWTPAFLVGIGISFRRQTVGGKLPAPGRSFSNRFAARLQKAARSRGYLLALLWLVVPLVVMSCAPDKAARYLLPLLPVAATLAARGLLALFVGARRGAVKEGAALTAHLVLIAGALIALPLAGLTPLVLSRVDGGAWYSWGWGTVALAASLAVTIVLFWLMRRRPRWAIAGAAISLYAAHALAMWGYKDSPDGRSEMRPIAERILSREPPVQSVAYYEPEGKPMPPDLAIYLSRVVRPLAAMEQQSEATPEVLVTLQREERPPPEIPGWRPFASEPYNERHWIAMEPADLPSAPSR